MEHLVRTVRRNASKEVTSIEIATLREYTSQLG